jgi:hypothetical protein
MLIMLIIRLMMILNVWYTVTQAANISVRAAALTGQAEAACRLMVENLPGFDPQRLKFAITFGTDQRALCEFSVEQSTRSLEPIVHITVTPGLPKFVPPVTPSATPSTPTPGQTAIPTFTPDPIGSLDVNRLADAPIRVEVTYDIQIVGAFLPAWTIRLSAAATARLETRAKIVPTPTLVFF